MRIFTKKTPVIFLVLVASLVAFLSAGAHEHESTGEAGAINTQSPLVEEMLRLDVAFRDVVSGVATGDGKRVYTAIESLHGTMEKTHEGVHHGTVKLRKNVNKLDEFISRDKQFHKALERLGHAAEKNNQAAMVSLTKELLDGCVACHRDFR